MNNTVTHMQGLSMAAFLEKFWQKRPCVIKQFIPDFEDPLDEHELAGLAQEDDIDSRLISLFENKWQVTQGPIEDFEPLCKGAWTLLVQGVDRFVPDIDALSECVKQIGNWRMDDVMVSFSTVGAGVGPHIDQYDVFIVQGKGSRRWQVGLPCQHETLLPHPLLTQISEFIPLIDEVLESGDAIYIPPKHPHNGVALNDCLNYSIGFRAPTNLEVLNGLLDEGEALSAAQQRYTDPDIYEYRDSTLSSASVSDSELNRLRISIAELLNSYQAQEALMQSISRQGLPDMRPEQSYELEEVIELLESGTQWVKAPGVKPIYAQTQASGFRFFIDGQTFLPSQEISAFARSLIDEPITPSPVCKDANQLKEYALLLLQLLNKGYIDQA
jgi:50S ribosomal protein L16 3-hydroxylase